MKKKFLVLIALTFILTACSSKPKQEEIKDNKKKITTENKKELKIQNAPMFSNFKVINKNNKEFIKADIKNDKDKIKTLKVLDTFKIPFTKQKESVEFLRSLWDLKYKKEIVEKIEKEVKAIKNIKKIKEIAKKEEKKSNESKNIVKDEKELAQKSETLKKEIVENKETKKIVETKSQKIVGRKREKETVNETKKDKYTTSIEEIPFKIIDNYASTGAKSRVYQEGEKGIKKITYKNGAYYSEKITKNPINKIIERYIKVKDRVEEKKEVEDKTKPVYGKRNPKKRWFVKTNLGIEYFYTSIEAENRKEELGKKGYLGNWGTAEPEYETYLVGYDTKTEKVVVQEEKWEWKR
ncbi:hypothetical protein [Helcococcus ovis]|uniref:hypothetical protein n=1 Tax=Helcococcus ovis TaxID=72026 RepID=UPI0038B7D4CE